MGILNRTVFSGSAGVLAGLLLLFSTGEVFSSAAERKPATVPLASQLPVTKGILPLASSSVACVSCPAPEYPIEAARRGIRGVVDLELTVGEDGRVEAVRVLATPCDELKNAALKAAQDWTFTPAVHDGKPVREVVQVPVVFRLFQSYARMRRVSSNAPKSSAPKAP